jgi:nitrogen fixation protein FixH
MKFIKFNKPVLNFKIYWPYFIFGAFLVVLAVNVTYVVVANKTWRGLFTENSYKKGLNYNNTLKKVEEQKKLGIEITTHINKQSFNNFRIETFVKDKTNNFIADLKVIYILRYKPDSKYDLTINAEDSNDRIFRRASVVLDKSGDWEIETAVSNQEFVAQDIRYINVSPVQNNDGDKQNYEK